MFYFQNSSIFLHIISNLIKFLLYEFEMEFSNPLECMSFVT